jgi:hypothetical protein
MKHENSGMGVGAGGTGSGVRGGVLGVFHEIAAPITAIPTNRTITRASEFIADRRVDDQTSSGMSKDNGSMTPVLSYALSTGIRLAGNG